MEPEKRIVFSSKQKHKLIFSHTRKKRHFGNNKNNLNFYLQSAGRSGCSKCLAQYSEIALHKIMQLQLCILRPKSKTREEGIYKPTNHPHFLS